MTKRFMTAFFLVGLPLVAGGFFAAKGGSVQAAAVAESPSSADIAKGLVGSWRGYGLFVHDRSFIYRADAFFRFTEYGVFIGNVGQTGGSGPTSFRGDYVVVGGAVLMSLEGAGSTPHYMTNVRLTADQLAFVVPGTGQTFFGTKGGGFILTRE